MSDVATIIVTFNNEDTILQCLKRVKGHEVADIVIVDNGSSDKTVAIARREKVHVIERKENTGFAAAANCGAWLMRAKYTLFLNPDAEICTPLQPAVEVLRLSPHVGIVGLGLYDASGKMEQHAFGQEPSLTRMIAGKVYHNSVKEQASDWVSGGAMLVRSDLFRRLGGFDEKFFLYWEDVDLCRRARLKGYVVVHLPAVKVKHQRGASEPDQKRKTALYDQSADRYFQKHYAAPIWLLQRFLRQLYRWVQPLAR